MFRTVKNDRGFTLIELLVVIAIIAILAAVAIPALMRYTHRAREARVLGELASFKTVVEAWTATDGKGHYPETGTGLSEEGTDVEEWNIFDVMHEADIDWDALENPWGGPYVYQATEPIGEGDEEVYRGFIIWTECEPEEDMYLYVTNRTDPVKAAGNVDDDVFTPTEPETVT